MARKVLSRVASLGRAASTIFGLALVLALMIGLASAALAGTGVNGVFNLGVTNTVDAVTRLVSNAGTGPNGPMLAVDNNGTGATATGIQILTEPGKPPMRVNQPTRVPNLNADLLDGLNSTDLRRKYAQTVVVAKSGGDFTTVQAALASITDAAAGKRYLVWVAPGTYDGRVQMKSFVDIEGAGELATKLTAPGGQNSLSAASSVVTGANDAELRNLTVENTGGSDHAIAIFNGSASPRLSNVTAVASGSALLNQGVANAASSPEMTHVTATASGSNAPEEAAFGVANSGDSSPTMTDVTAKGSGAHYNVGVNNAGSSPTMTDVTATASGGDTARGVENSTSSPEMTDVVVTASGGSGENTGVQNGLHSSPTIRESYISASGTNSRGVKSFFPDDTVSLVTIENSEVEGATGTIRAEGGYKVNVGASKLDGGAVSTSGTGSEIKCAGVHDENYTFSPNTCP